jgi:prepilin peptidase CpaA
VNWEFAVRNTPVWMGPGSNLLAVDALNVLTLVMLVACGFSDLFYHKIFNKVTYPAMLLGVTLNATASGFKGLQSSLIGLVLGFGIFFGAFLFGGVGGGDVKLMGAVGALQGYPFIIYAISFSVLFGFLGALYAMIMSGRLFPSLRRVFRVLWSYVVSAVLPGYNREALDPKNSAKVRFGYGCAVGTMVAWLLTGLDFFKMV